MANITVATISPSDKMSWHWKVLQSSSMRWDAAPGDSQIETYKKVPKMGLYQRENFDARVSK